MIDQCDTACFWPLQNSCFERRVKLRPSQMPKRSLNRSSAACATSVLQDGAFGMGKSPKIWEDLGPLVILGTFGDLWGRLKSGNGFIADVLIVAGGWLFDDCLFVGIIITASEPFLGDTFCSLMILKGYDKKIRAFRDWLFPQDLDLYQLRTAHVEAGCIP